MQIIESIVFEIFEIFHSRELNFLSLYLFRISNISENLRSIRYAFARACLKKGKERKKKWRSSFSASEIVDKTRQKSRNRAPKMVAVFDIYREPGRVIRDRFIGRAILTSGILTIWKMGTWGLSGGCTEREREREREGVREARKGRGGQRERGQSWQEGKRSEERIAESEREEHETKRQQACLVRLALATLRSSGSTTRLAFFVVNNLA